MLRPYFIYYAEKPAGATQDDEGNFVGDAPLRWFFYGEGRDSVNSKGNTRKLADGSTYQYSAVIYAAPRGRILTEGTPILVSAVKVEPNCITESFINNGLKSGRVRIYQNCAGFTQGQLNARIWV